MPEPAAIAPAHQLKVLSVKCSPNYGRPRIDLAVQNTGQTTLEFPKAVASFGGAINDSYLSPNTLRPGGIATASFYSPAEGDSADCSLVAIQDGDGFAATLSR